MPDIYISSFFLDKHQILISSTPEIRYKLTAALSVKHSLMYCQIFNGK